jgi:CRP-like cAMP-binding protein
MASQARIPKLANPISNLLLQKLSPADFESLMAKAKVVTLKFRRRLFAQDGVVDVVYFPLECMVSLLVTTGTKPKLELATIGREGVVGAIEIMQEQDAMGINLIQIPGLALRIGAEDFLAEVGARPGLLKVIQRHQYALLRQILYAASCNRTHSMEERCARWLLMTHDRAGQDNFPLTQEFLSHMLGVRRATVNVALGMLKRAGFIRFVRGRITVLDRQGLEASSCECYRLINKAYNSAMATASA